MITCFLFIQLFFIIQYSRINGLGEYSFDENDQKLTMSVMASKKFKKWFENGGETAEIKGLSRRYFFAPKEYMPYEVEDVCTVDIKITLMNISINRNLTKSDNLTLYFLCEGLCCHLNCCLGKPDISPFLRTVYSISYMLPIAFVIVLFCNFFGAPIGRFICRTIDKIIDRVYMKWEKVKGKCCVKKPEDSSDDDSDDNDVNNHES